MTVGTLAPLHSGTRSVPAESRLAPQNIIGDDPRADLPRVGVSPLAGTREILGAGHGAWWRSASGLLQDHPDPGWAAAEARSIRAAANPSVWLLVSHSYRLELFIYPELERLGGRLELAYGADGVVLRRYRFP